MIGARYQRIIVIIMTLAGFIVIGLLLFFLLLPTLRDVNTLSQNVLDAQTELEAQYANRKNLLKSISKLEHIRNTTNNLKSQFIKPGEELTFITRIEEIADKNGVESSIRLGGTSTKDVNDSFDIGLIGTYPNVLDALRSIERLPNITLITSVNLRAGDLPKEGPTIVSVSAKGTIAFMPEGL